MGSTQTPSDEELADHLEGLEFGFDDGTFQCRRCGSRMDADGKTVYGVYQENRVGASVPTFQCGDCGEPSNASDRNMMSVVFTATGETTVGLPVLSDVEVLSVIDNKH